MRQFGNIKPPQKQQLKHINPNTKTRQTQRLKVKRFMLEQAISRTKG
jgi:hypothetical protein